MLNRLIAEEIDPNDDVREPAGRRLPRRRHRSPCPRARWSAATSQDVPLCTADDETGCVVTWATFRVDGHRRPPSSFFGRPRRRRRRRRLREPGGRRRAAPPTSTPTSPPTPRPRSCRRSARHRGRRRGSTGVRRRRSTRPFVSRARPGQRRVHHHRRRSTTCRSTVARRPGRPPRRRHPRRPHPRVGPPPGRREPGDGRHRRRRRRPRPTPTPADAATVRSRHVRHPRQPRPTTGCCSPRTATATPTRPRCSRWHPAADHAPGADGRVHLDRDPPGGPHPRRACCRSRGGCGAPRWAPTSTAW